MKPSMLRSLATRLDHIGGTDNGELGSGLPRPEDDTVSVKKGSTLGTTGSISIEDSHTGCSEICILDSGEGGDLERGSCCKSLVSREAEGAVLDRGAECLA